VNTAVPQALAALAESSLYRGDKALLEAFITSQLAKRETKPDLLALTPDANPNANTKAELPGISGFITPKHHDALSNTKASVAGFIKAVKDNTTYDLPSNAARALQNSYLLPLYQQTVQSESLSNGDRVDFFNGLLEADTAIGHQLQVSRTVDTEKPLYGNYLPYLV
jgi:hypothetical protein